MSLITGWANYFGWGKQDVLADQASKVKAAMDAIKEDYEGQETPAGRLMRPLFNALYQHVVQGGVQQQQQQHGQPPSIPMQQVSADDDCGFSVRVILIVIRYRRYLYLTLRRLRDTCGASQQALKCLKQRGKTSKRFGRQEM
jgi:hypothetical protein